MSRHAQPNVPVPEDTARVDWEAQRMTCPQGRLSIGWTEAVDRGHNEVIKVKFSMRDCRTCPSREKCTRGSGGR